ncbi:MAG TPA: LuxR C-terminal-related transcriptional regulator [Micromonosporaceae bacterium]|nr:LuxR C-terminal-related transcriptional regulator [Micromonosporaceae bacterium]
MHTATPPRGGTAGRSNLVAAAVTALATPGLVVLTGGPGAGRSTALRHLGAAFRGPTFAGGALAMLRTVPGLALSRAVRVRLPPHDPNLLAEAVRSRVRHGLLLLDDVQWADPATLAALPAIAAHCRVAVALRTPHPLSAPVEQALRGAAAAWLSVPPLGAPEAAALVRRLAPAAGSTAVAEVVRRAGGVPLAVTALAQHLAQEGTPSAPPEGGGPQYAIAVALADLTRPARTALAALGLLGRPTATGVLGDGVAELAGAGLVDVADGLVTPASPYTAEVAAGLLDPAERRAVHRRLAELVPAAEAARHLAAADDTAAAYQVAVAAARAAPTTGERAELLLLACTLPDVVVDPSVRLAAARAALDTGRPGTCLRLLAAEPGAADPGAADPSRAAAVAVLRGEALLQRQQPAAAASAVAVVGEHAAEEARLGRDRIRLLAALATGSDRTGAMLARIVAAHGDPPPHPGLRAAVAVARAAARRPGWEYGLASAAATAGAAGDVLAARWSAWALVESLADDGRLREAAAAATSAAQACADDLGYSWQTRFVAAALWCTALGGDLDPVLSRAGDLLGRTLPASARGYAVAALSLAEADSGLLRPARDRLRGLPAGSDRPAPAAILDWVAREAAWLDGQPDLAAAGAPRPATRALTDALLIITGYWSGHDLAATARAGDGPPPLNAPSPPDAPHAGPVAQTLDAWAAGHRDGTPGDRFQRAAAAWHGVAPREQVRCLLAHALFDPDPASAVPVLLAAERLATAAGLVVLLGRTHRALRRHAVRRDVRGRRTGDDLTDREREVLRLVATGEPTRRIAGQLGISRETVETHIRAGMRKLGARTRTEAAALTLGAQA